MESISITWQLLGMQNLEYHLDLMNGGAVLNVPGDVET